MRRLCWPLVRLLLIWMALSALACNKEPPNATPEGAVMELLGHLERFHQGDPEEANAAFALLSKATQEALTERSARYAAASGKRIAPALAIAPGSFHLKFSPKQVRARIEGPYAVVSAVGLLSEDRAEIPCVYEDGGWRVHLVVPPLAPMKTAPRDGNVSDL